jgi:hypothetical protein
MQSMLLVIIMQGCVSARFIITIARPGAELFTLRQYIYILYKETSFRPCIFVSHNDMEGIEGGNKYNCFFLLNILFVHSTLVASHIFLSPKNIYTVV